MKQIKNIRGMIISHIRGEAAEMRRLSMLMDAKTLDKDSVRYQAAQDVRALHKARRDMAISILADIPEPQAHDGLVSLNLDELLVVLQALVTDMRTDWCIGTETHNELQSVLHDILKKYGKADTCHNEDVCRRLFGVLSDWAALELKAKEVI